MPGAWRTECWCTVYKLPRKSGKRAAARDYFCTGRDSALR